MLSAGLQTFKKNKAKMSLRDIEKKQKEIEKKEIKMLQIKLAKQKQQQQNQDKRQSLQNLPQFTLEKISSQEQKKMSQSQQVIQLDYLKPLNQIENYSKNGYISQQEISSQDRIDENILNEQDDNIPSLDDDLLSVSSDVNEDKL